MEWTQTISYRRNATNDWTFRIDPEEGEMQVIGPAQLAVTFSELVESYALDEGEVLALFHTSGIEQLEEFANSRVAKS